MKVLEIKNIPSNPKLHGIETKKFHVNDYVQAVHITLKPGEKLTKHITAADVFFYVPEGKGIVETGEVKKEVLKDTYIDSPEKIPHCL